MSKSKEPVVTIEKITPDMCLEWLELNENNRPLKTHSINAFTRDMSTGRWVMNGESLKFDRHNNVLDGQHRMWACVEAGKPFTTMVIRGLPRAVFDTLDTGEKRAASDILAMNGEVNIHATSAALKYIGRYLNGSMMNIQRFTNKEIESILKYHPNIREFVKIATTPSLRVRWCSGSVVATCWYLAHQINAEQAKNFFESFLLGTNLLPGSPILVLRNKLIDIKSNPLQKLKPEHRIQLIIVAWNLWRKEKTLKHFRLSATLVTTSAEFPEFK